MIDIFLIKHAYAYALTKIPSSMEMGCRIEKMLFILI